MDTVKHNTGSLSGLSLASPGDYYALMKPRVMSLVVFTAMVGLICAPASMNPFLAAASILCIAAGAGAAGALNMWYDRDIDAVMSRTKKRPLPAGKVSPSSVLAFGVIMSVVSVFGLSMAANYLAAGLLAFTIFYYFVVYSMWLKRRTAQNIVIGGASGAFPPMVAWAAVTGDVSLESAVLFAIIFMWTPPHFWSLSLFACKDYANAGIPMLPVVRGEAHTKKQIMLYTAFMVLVSLLPWYFGFAGIFYAATAALMGGMFIWLSYALLTDKSSVDENNASAKKALFAVLGIENLIGRIL